MSDDFTSDDQNPAIASDEATTESSSRPERAASSGATPVSPPATDSAAPEESVILSQAQSAQPKDPDEAGPDDTAPTPAPHATAQRCRVVTVQRHFDSLAIHRRVTEL